MNEFIWTDLSTYKLEESVAFYQSLMNWKFENDNSYYIGGKNGKHQVGIYETPSFFQKIGMPHFWMNYLHVESLENTTNRAIELGAKVELNNVPFYGGMIALIRDPMGAGFTVYQGKGLARHAREQSSNIGLRELHTSDSDLVIPFYQDLFHWEVEQLSAEQYHIRNQEQKDVCTILQLDNDLKGQYEYWVTQFYVTKLSDTVLRLQSLGGNIIMDEGNRMLATDEFGEAFFYLASRD